MGAPYNTSLPAMKESTKPLKHSLPFKYSTLDGKHMTGVLLEGHLLALSSTMALIKAEEELELLSNIRLEFPIEEKEGSVIYGDLYAKVVQANSQDDGIKIRFTAVPEDVAEAIRHLCL